MDTFIGLDQGRRIIANGTTKVVKILEGLGEPQIKSEFTSDDYIELYTTIYTMCTQTPPHDYSSQLYANYRDTFQDYLTTKVVPSLREKHGEFMLRELVRRWANHKIMVRWLSRFFDYLHRHYISQRGLPLLSQVSLRCFSDIVYNECKVNARDAVLSLIGREREGEQIDRALLKNVLNVFLEIGSGDTTYNYYVNDFEKSMLKASVDYYSRKASNWIIEDSYADYMIKTDAYLKREKESVAHYLPSSSQEKLLEKVQHELLYVYCPRLLEKKDLGFRDLLIAEKVEDLSMLFRLLLNIPRGVEPVSAIFQTHVIYEGTTLIKQAEDSGSNKKVFVRNVLDLHDKFSAYVNDCFRNHILYRKALKEGFAIVCSKSISGSSCSELIAAYCDTLLKKGASEKLSDEAIEEALENVLKLMTCIVDKDLFGEFYRKKMSQRLLFDKSCNDEHERSFLAKLKQQFGANFTSKMEGMLTDMTLARENQSSFDEYLSQNPGIDFSVTVLTTSFWPRYKTVDLHLPPEMVECVASFREFYKTKAENRKLTFNNSLGTCIVNGRFDAKTIELSVTTHQAATLLLFNDSDKMSFREIATRLNLPDDDVIRLLHSLSCGRYKILNKEPSTKIISRADTFEYNSKFKNEKRKIKVPLPPLNERHKVIEDVDKHRAYTIDASIVRIMKSRKVLGYEQLVSECVEQLNRMFKPDVATINKRIKRLIERDYLERDKDNNKIIKYLA